MTTTLGPDGPSPRQRHDDPFFDGVVRRHVDDDGYVRREWLESLVQERLQRTTCRYVVLVGEPGAGKSGVMASLAAHQPDWPRYFVRQDSIAPLAGGDAVSFLLSVGHQLAARRPGLFAPERLEVVVHQRVAAAGAAANVVGVKIEDLVASPFHRTAIRVEQDVEDLGGRLVGVEVARATVEPRLLAEENLQFLALIDPATALAASEPEARVVVLLDAADEVLGFHGSAMTVLDWLERSPELPANVRVVVSSRPHSRLETVKGVRAGTVEVIDLNEAATEVMSDARTFAAEVVTAPPIAARVRHPEELVERVAVASEGNFAYLRAWQRALVASVTDGNDELADRLLGLEVLPAGLGALYTTFLRNARADIERLGSLDVQEPRGPDDEVAPAWEGAGRRVVGVLAVARGALSVDQLMRLGAVRVWRSSADGVMQRLRTLLDEEAGAWQFFHRSVAEFLTGEAEREAPDLFVDGSEWHRRVVRSYQGRAAWAEVDWASVDDYGLLHTADHLAELGIDGQRQVIELVTPGLRSAARARFRTDLPFQRLVDGALSHIDNGRAPAEVLADQLFLAVVRTTLSSPGRLLAPAVFGLMARVGRFPEAQALIELLRPSEHRFRSTQALVECTVDAERHLLGRHDGVDLLVAAATEISVADGGLFGGMTRRHCVEEAAVALATHDLDRALALAAEIEESPEAFDVRDRVLLAAAEVQPATGRVPLVDRMRGARAAAAAELASLLEVPERERLLALAEDDVTHGRATEPVVVLARLVAAWRPTEPGRADAFAAELRAAIASGEVETNHVLTAAEIVATVDPDLADALLDVIPTSSWDGVAAVRHWVARGRPEKARALAEHLLEEERARGWFGPASTIAALAVAVDEVDPSWARALADEAEHLIVAAATTSTDPYETRISATLGSAAEAVRTWDPGRAVRLARRMHGSWIPGARWDSFSGRLSALACLGIDVCATDPLLAGDLLDECVPTQEPDLVLGRQDARFVRGGLFRPEADVPTGELSMSRAMNFAVYMQNAVSYWARAREQLPFVEPADVVRSMRMAPGVNGSTASWAGVVAAAVVPIATVDLDAAIALPGWIADPAERVIGVAGLVAALADADDPRAGDALAALGRSVVGLPHYTAELDVATVDRVPALRYLDPTARARFEAATLLPDEHGSLALSLMAVSESRYLLDTVRAQQLFDLLWGPVACHTDGAEVAGYVRQIVAEGDANADPIQRELVRVAAAVAVAPWDHHLLAATLAGIHHPGRALVARMSVALMSITEADDLAVAARRLLDDVPTDADPAYPVCVAAMAMRALDDDAKGELTDRAVALLSDAAPRSVAQGFAELAWSAAPQRRADLTRTALRWMERVENPYLRDDLLSDLFAVAARSGDVELLVATARRELDAGWEVLMEGLRRGIGPLVELAGPEVIARLDDAFRAAQAIAGPAAAAGPLDGVAPPTSRDPAPIAARAPSPQPRGSIRHLYLADEDLPGMTLEHDGADTGPEPDDYAYVACDGVGTGLRAWLADAAGPFSRVVDIRVVLPDAERAAAYYRERLLALGEGLPPVPDAPPVGTECRVVGGPARSRQGGELTVLCYLLRVEAVVAKLFVVQRGRAADPHDVGRAHAIAERLAARLRST